MSISINRQLSYLFQKYQRCTKPFHRLIELYFSSSNSSYKHLYNGGQFNSMIDYKLYSYRKQNNSYILNNFRCMAGHAKWQNVKHIKAERDSQKNLLCNKYARMITYAVKEAGPDPKSNIKLANLLEEARKKNVPNSTIESILKRSSNKKSKYGSVEILAPGGCLILLEYETDNVSTTRHDIKVSCKKYSANLLSGEGRWRAVFQQKGILKANIMIGDEKISAEKALDSAIEAGAEEVQQREDEDETPYLEFTCDPNDLHSVKKELERMSFNLDEAYIGYIPMTNVVLMKEDETLVDGLLMELSDMQEVTRIFENAQ